MAAPKYAKRTDGNHKEVMRWFEALHCSVLPQTNVGYAGVPDLLIGKCGESWFAEVKDPTRKPSERKLRPDQLEFAEMWKGGPVRKIETFEDCVKMVNDMRARSLKKLKQQDTERKTNGTN